MEDKVYSAGYRRLNRTGRGVHPARPIARTMLALAWRRRSTKLLLLLCLGVFIGHLVWVVSSLLASHFDQATQFTTQELAGRIFGSSREIIGVFLSTQFYVTAFAVAGIAGGCVANDRRLGAFDLIFARPLSPLDYAVGKLLGVGAICVVTLVIPAFLIWLVAVGIAPTHLRADLWWLIVPAVMGALLASALLTATLVGLSAHSLRGQAVTAIYIAALALGSAFMEGAAASVDLAGYLAPERSLRTVIEWFLEFAGPIERSAAGSFAAVRESSLNDSVFGSALALLTYIGGGLYALRLRLRWEVVQ